MWLVVTEDSGGGQRSRELEAFRVALFTTSSDKKEKCSSLCDGFELIIGRSYSYQV